VPKGQGRRVLLVDHEDSFVHTLANYFRQTGAEVLTTRTPVDDAVFDDFAPDLVVLSPGPGNPKDFDCHATIDKAMQRQLPIFGVCLGMQAIAEYFGAELAQLDIPMHGKPSRVAVSDSSRVFAGLPEQVTIGRYHSLYAKPETVPTALGISAQTADGIPMGVEHSELPIAAVQFHPESIMSLGQDCGIRMIENVVSLLVPAKGSPDS
jgi:anthranilate synthase